jgi:hypothetical protein
MKLFETIRFELIVMRLFVVAAVLRSALIALEQLATVVAVVAVDSNPNQ